MRQHLLLFRFNVLCSPTSGGAFQIKTHEVDKHLEHKKGRFAIVASSTLDMKAYHRVKFEHVLPSGTA